MGKQNAKKIKALNFTTSASKVVFMYNKSHVHTQIHTIKNMAYRQHSNNLRKRIPKFTFTGEFHYNHKIKAENSEARMIWVCYLVKNVLQSCHW